MDVKIYDEQFPHAKTMANGGLEIVSKNFNWNRNITSDTAFITESWFHRLSEVPEKRKIGLLIEPRGFRPQEYNWIRENYNLFDYVLTHDIELCKLSDKFLFYIYGGAWVYNYQIYEKSKNVSIVASDKRILPGHHLRHALVAQNLADVYGHGYNPIASLLTAYKDYRFTIAIENESYNYWITEKLITPLLCGVVPFYWGCPDIGKIFNIDGIIQFNDLHDLKKKLEGFDFVEEYQDRENAIKENFELAKKYAITEDYLFREYPFLFL